MFTAKYVRAVAINVAMVATIVAYLVARDSFEELMVRLLQVFAMGVALGTYTKKDN